MTHSITVVSLGPGPLELITLEAERELKNAEKIILRTGVACGAADELRKKGIPFETLDFLHEECEDFDELTRQAAEYVLAAAEKGPVCYGVFDASADETVKAIAQSAEIRVVAGVPLSAPVLAAAPGLSRVEIQTASSLEVTSLQNPLLILEWDSRMLAGQCKLQLLRWYDPEQPTLFFPPWQGGPRRFVEIPLCEADRQPKYDHTCALLVPPMALEQRRRFDFYDLVRVMDILRGEDGCPWDREQDHHTLRKYLIEEAYETGAAIDEEDWDHTAEELGDVLLQVVFQSKIGSQLGTFELSDVTSHICRKMIARHRHIFGGDQCATAEDVRRNWEKIKMEERGISTPLEAVESVSPGLPPLVRAGKVQKKARDAGLTPPDTEASARDAAEAALQALTDPAGQNPEDALGDLLLACVRLAALRGADPEAALSRSTERFIRSLSPS